MGSHTVEKRLGTRRYRKLTSRLDESLLRRKFDEAAKIGASIAALSASSDALAILLSAAQTFKEGEVKHWAPEASRIAEAGVERAQEVSKVKLSPRTQGVVKSALTEAAERTKSKR